MPLIKIDTARWQAAKEFFAKKTPEEEVNSNDTFIKIDAQIFAVVKKEVVEQKCGFLKNLTDNGFIVAQTESDENFLVKIYTAPLTEKEKKEHAIFKELSLLKFEELKKTSNHTIIELPKTATLTRLDINDIDLKEKLTLALNCAKFVGLLHQKNIIHGHIHPGNFIIDAKDSNIKICMLDFSTSYMLQKGEKEIADKIIHGSTPYLAPEIASPAKTKGIALGNTRPEYKESTSIYSFASDIYALGVVFGHLLNLKENDTLNTFVAKMLDDEKDNRPEIQDVIQEIQDTIELEELNALTRAAEWEALIQAKTPTDKQKAQSELQRIEKLSFQEFLSYAKELTTFTACYSKNPIHSFIEQGKGFFPAAALQLLLKKAGFPSAQFIAEIEEALIAFNKAPEATTPDLTSSNPLKQKIIKEFCEIFKKVALAFTPLTPLTKDDVKQHNYIMALFKTLCILPLATNEAIRNSDEKKIFSKIFKETPEKTTDLTPLKAIIFPLSLSTLKEVKKSKENNLLLPTKSNEGPITFLRSMSLPTGFNFNNQAEIAKLATLENQANKTNKPKSS